MSDQERWEALERRDTAMDGAFVYGVTSTGVYCRPSCKSRRPNRKNVRFFDRPVTAEAEGFRPCRRCRPDEERPLDARLAIVRRVCAMIDRHLAEMEEGVPTLAELAGAVGYSPHHLQRTFKRVMGITPREYLAERRLGRFKRGLRAGESVTEALYDAGFGSPSRLYEQSNRALGMTPAAYARGGAGIEIAYVVTPAPLGLLLVGATERGVSAIYLGEDKGALIDALVREYPGARLREDKKSLGRFVGVLVDYLNGEGPHPDLPLDLRISAFQRRVFQVLMEIPYGETRSYAEIARAMGQPKAARAVARACATNPVSLAVPCHRVVGADGALRGYRWGLARKLALLALEAEHKPDSSKT